MSRSKFLKVEVVCSGHVAAYGASVACSCIGACVHTYTGSILRNLQN